MDLLRLATEQGADVDKLEKLMALQERWQANKSRAAFFAAIADFQSECPDLRKTKAVNFETKSGGSTNYNYAPLADIARQIKVLMKKHSLSYRWEFQDKSPEIVVTCLVTHTEGHTEKTTMSALADVTGSKNPIQARGSAIEYLKRYTLIGALGLSTADSDIDGRLPEQSIDKLHAEFMEVYNMVIQKDSSLTKYHPDNWKTEPSAQGYVKGIKELRKVLSDLTPKA